VGGIENAAVRNVARLGVGAVQFPAEQQMADNVTSTADLLLPEAYQFNTKYGVLGDLLNGSKGRGRPEVRHAGRHGRRLQGRSRARRRG
jgi:hypothetical protein